MKLTKSIFLLIVVTAFSCSEQEEIQPENINNEETFDDLNSNEGNDVPYSILFSIENESGFETNSSISFHNQSENLTDFQWDFGDGTFTTELNSDHSYSSPGKYVVTLTGISSQGLSVSFSKDVFVRNHGSQLDLLFISFQDSSLNYVDLGSNTVTKLYDVPYNPSGVLALDEANRRVYYYDYTLNMVIENGLDINSPKTLFQDLPGVSDMEFDQTSNKLFIALSYDDLIISYDLANQNITTSQGSSNNGKFGKVQDMDFKDGYLYTITSTQSYESVFKVDINGGNVNQLIDEQAGGFGYGVAYDDLNDKLYFNNVQEAGLMRSDPDGSNIEKVIDMDRYGTVSFAGLCLVGLKVVETRNQLLWSAWDDNSLHILDLQTSQEVVIKIDGLYGKFVPFENNEL